MGIKNLNSLIELHSPSGIQNCSLTSFRGKKMAVDANVYLYKYMYGKTTPIDGIFFMVNKFKKFHITPVFVFDGKPPSEKEMTLQYRKQMKSRIELRIHELNQTMEQVSFQDGNTTAIEDELRQQLQQNERRLIYISDDIIHLVKTLFDAMGVPYIDSPMEAEHLCAKLCRQGYVDAVVSEDMDAIACGSPVVLREFSNRRDDVRVYTMGRILDDMGITYPMFVDMCILLGNDYMPRARGYTPDMIYRDICEHTSIDQIKLVRPFRLPEDYQCNRLRAILNLEDVILSGEELTAQLQKQQDLLRLRDFMHRHSTIDMNTITNRLDKMYSRSQEESSDIRNKVEAHIESKLPWFSVTARESSGFRSIRDRMNNSPIRVHLSSSPPSPIVTSFVH
jgi:flap endonuclease-1